MFQAGPISAYEIECDLAERNRASLAIDEMAWYQSTASLEPSWLAIALLAAGQTLIKLGHQLEHYSLRSAPALGK